MPLFVIKNINTGEILEETVSLHIEETWNKCLGFKAVDDQWSWQRQKAESSGYYAVEVDLIEKPNKEIDQDIKSKIELYKKSHLNCLTKKLINYGKEL